MGQALCGKLVDEELGELVTLDYNRMCCVLWGVCQGLLARVEALEKKGKSPLLIENGGRRSRVLPGARSRVQRAGPPQALPDRPTGPPGATGPHGCTGSGGAAHGCGPAGAGAQATEPGQECGRGSQRPAASGPGGILRSASSRMTTNLDRGVQYRLLHYACTVSIRAHLDADVKSSELVGAALQLIHRCWSKGCPPVKGDRWMRMT